MKALTLAEYKERGIKPERGAPILCGYCGKTFPYVPKNHRQAFCPGGNCTSLDQAARNRVKLEPRECVVCGKDFTPEHPRYKACPGECRVLRGKAKGEEETVTPDEAIRRRELSRYESQLREGVGRTAILADLLTDAVERVNERDIKPRSMPRRSKRDPETMVVLRSDWHPGTITPSYNLGVFHERTDLFTEKIILIRDIISQTIPIEKLVLVDLGDMVSGQDIYPGQAWKSEKHVLEQIYHEASPALIKQNMTMLEYFPLVEEYSVPGNHGRTGKYAPLEVNFDTVLMQDIYRRFEGVKRFSMSVEWDWWQYLDIYDWTFLTLHGNQIRSWLNIPFYGLIQKGMRWQGSMKRPWQYLLHGHFHTPFIFPWNDFEIIGNGTLVSDDDFGLRELGMSSTPAQQVFGVHPEHGVTWRYTLDLSS